MDHRCSPTRPVVWRLIGRRAAEGQALVEYTLIFILIIIACFAILGVLSATIDEQYFKLIEAIPWA